MSTRHTVLNFSASDSAGNAGIAMDIRTQMALGVHSLSAITANTAQNNATVRSINGVDESAFEDQIYAISELPISAIKIGLIGSKNQCEQIVKCVEHCSIPTVLDPVLLSSSGLPLIEEDVIAYIKQTLLPKVTLLTPNLSEAEALTGITIKCHDDFALAANQLLSMGVNAVLIKGGHFELSHSTYSDDFFSDGKKAFWLSNSKIKTSNTRGTGCALSSSIAASLALGYSLYDAVVIGKMAISQGLRQAYSISSNNETTEEPGPVFISHFPNQQIDLPFLSLKPLTSGKPFPACNDTALGLYPVVDRADWIENLAGSGITTIQLRNKDLTGRALEDDILKAITIAKKHNIRLFINDYWELAIKYGAYGVHLGQEDLDDADIDLIRASGLRLGISTHCHYEVARAHAYQPSYIACGPVYHTTTKDMPWVPHGLTGLRYWRETLNYPLVAIGGINNERFDAVAATGVDSVAMITAITLSDEPISVAKEFNLRFENANAAIQSNKKN